MEKKGEREREREREREIGTLFATTLLLKLMHYCQSLYCLARAQSKYTIAGDYRLAFWQLLFPCPGGLSAMGLMVQTPGLVEIGAASNCCFFFEATPNHCVLQVRKAID